MSEKEIIVKPSLQDTSEMLLEKLNKKVLIVKDTGISNRIIYNWQIEGLIDEYRKDKTLWRKFSVLEVLWITIISQLRDIGYSIAILKKVKETLFLPTINDFGIRKNLNTFEHNILQVIIFFRPSFMVINSDGKVNIFNDVSYMEGLKSGELNFHHFISLNWLMKENFPELFSYPLFKEFPNLSAKEVRLISIVREDNFQSIRIKKKNREIDMVEGIERIDVERKIIDLLNDGDYQNIELKQENGKIVNVNRTIKRKL